MKTKKNTVEIKKLVSELCSSLEILRDYLDDRNSWGDIAVACDNLACELDRNSFLHWLDGSSATAGKKKKTARKEDKTDLFTG